MATTSLPPPPLARKRELGVFLDSFPLRRPPPHYHHPLSLANASWGCFSIRFPCDGRHLTTTTPSHSQTRVGGVSQFIFFATAATSLPPPPLARKCELGVFLMHDSHTPLPRPKSETEGVSFLFLRHHPPLPRPKSETEGGLVSISAAPPPSLAPTARRRGFVCFYGTNPLPRPNSETEGVRLLCYSTTAPSLALSEQRGSICLVVIRYIIVYIVVIRYIIGYIY